MTKGANLSRRGGTRTLARILELLGSKAHGSKPDVSRPSVFWKDGAPANDTAADDPGAVGTLILDNTNDDVYVCTVYASASSFTVVKITP